MDDLKRPFAVLDDVEAPDLWGDASTRAPRVTQDVDHRPRQRATAAVVAVLIFLAAGAFAWRMFDRATDPATPKPDPDSPLDAVGVGWTRLPNPSGPSVGGPGVWTGTELIVVGGRDTVQDHASTAASAYDPATGAWSELPPAPLHVSGSDALWTGSEALFFTSLGGETESTSSWGGVAFDPATRSWRVIADPPLMVEPAAVVWAGGELIAWGGGSPGEASNVHGAAYDPSSDSWRPIADAPIGLNAADGVWTGSEMIVFGSLLDGRNVATTRYAVGAIYDPETDIWREMSPSALSPQASAAVWDGERMVAFDYDWRASAYDAATDQWQQLADLGFKDAECYPDGAVVGGSVFAFGCGEAAVLPAGSVGWEPVDGGLTEDRLAVEAGQDPAGEYAVWRFVNFAPAGDVVFMVAEGVTLSDGSVCYGCVGSPMSVWAYRPPPEPSAPTITEIQLTSGAWHLVVAYGSVWVTEPSGVFRIDPETGSIESEIAVERMDDSDITAGGGRIWVTTRDSVVGIDVETNTIDRTLATQTGIRSVLFHDGKLYIGHSAEGNGDLSEIDPDTGAFLRSTLTGGDSFAESILAAGGAYWVGYTSPDPPSFPAGLVRVSADFAQVDVVPGVDRVFSMAEAGGYIWAVGTDVLYQIEMTGARVASYPFPRAGKIASDGTRLWLLRNTGSTSEEIYLPDPSQPTVVVELDASTGAQIGVAVDLAHHVPANLASADGVVWVAFYEDGVLTKVMPGDA